MSVAYNCCLITTEGTLVFIKVAPEGIDCIEQRLRAMHRRAGLLGVREVKAELRIIDGERVINLLDILVDGEGVREELLEKWKN